MQDRVAYIAVSREGDPVHVEHTSVILKLFFESETEERDADFFLNIDPTRSFGWNSAKRIQNSDAGSFCPS